MAGEVIHGLGELKALLQALPDRLRRRALRNALAAGARVVRDAAKRAAPVLSATSPAVLKGIRKPGTVRRALSVRTSKAAKRAGNVGVFVNVRPAPGARVSRGKAVPSQRGAKSPNDPFYWRWLQFGTKRMRPVPFLNAGVAKLREALQAFQAALAPQLAKLNRNPKDPL
jgi:HK97 gp10 family phage protein